MPWTKAEWQFWHLKGFGFYPKRVLRGVERQGAAAAVTFFIARRFGAGAANTLQRAMRLGEANDSWNLGESLGTETRRQSQKLLIAAKHVD